MSNELQVYDSFNPPGVPTLTIVGSDGSALVIIRRDTGEIEYGEGYEPDDAARVFWDAFSTLPTENERLREALQGSVDVITAADQAHGTRYLQAEESRRAVALLSETGGTDGERG